MRQVRPAIVRIKVLRVSTNSRGCERTLNSATSDSDVAPRETNVNCGAGSLHIAHGA